MREQTCANCKYSEPMCGALACMGQKYAPCVRQTDSCENWKSAKQTNADRIRAMSDEEMAAWFEELHDRNTCPEFGAWDCNPSCKKCWLDWLKQEVEE